jgi:preprotein translocase subunit SecD
MKVRILVVLSAVLVSILALLPTVVPSFDAPWISFGKIEADLPFEQGFRLVLEVDLEEALLAELMWDIRALEWRAPSDGVRIGSIKRVGYSGFKVSSQEDPKLIASYVEDQLVAYRLVESSGEEHRFEMLDQWQQRLKEAAFRNAVRTIEEKTAEACIDDAKIEPVGTRRILVKFKDDFTEGACKTQIHGHDLGFVEDTAFVRELSSRH